MFKVPVFKVPVVAQLAEPLLGALSFAAVMLLADYRGYNQLPLENYYGSIVVSSIAFWAGPLLRDNSEPLARWKVFQELFCLSFGLNLLAQALLAYTYGTLMIDNLPFYVLLAGSLLASLILAVLWPVLHPVSRLKPGVLLVGFDGMVERVAEAMQGSILGVVGSSGAPLPAGIPHLGEAKLLRQMLHSRNPGRVVVSREEAENGSVLLDLTAGQTQGIRVESAAFAYERVFDRTSIHGLSPEEFVSSARLATDRQTLAFQSVCNNLVGLAALAVLLPVMLMLVIAIRIFCGPGPGIEAVECVGFEKIPFRLLRFRTTRRDGVPRGFGHTLIALHLVNLPQFINVIRGEMAIFGPRPVRAEYAERLTQLVPFYSQMFAVKPGIISWAGLHMDQSSNKSMPDDWLRLEYDLYYIKQSSPLQDLEMLLRLLPGRNQ